MQRFVLQENIKLLAGRLAAAASEDDQRRIRAILADVERELAILDASDAAPETPRNGLAGGA